MPERSYGPTKRVVLTEDVLDHIRSMLDHPDHGGAALDPNTCHLCQAFRNAVRLAEDHEPAVVRNGGKAGWGG